MARALIAAQVPLCRNPASRFAFMAQVDGAVTLFVDGQSFDCVGDSALLARALCGRGDLMVDPALAGSDTALTLIAALIDQGSVAFDEGE
jgi:50S ribosomal protein L16 3-hydroxylase